MRQSIATLKPVLLYLLLFVLFIVPVVLVSCGEAPPPESEQPTTPGYENIAPEEFYEMTSQREVILDVRTVTEYNSGHIPGAILIPLSELESRLDELNPSDYILIYCSTGGCQDEAAPRILAENGFSHLWNLEGGFVEWQANGFPVTEPRPGYTNITPQEFYEMINQKEVVLDVRTVEEYNSGHIADAILIPLSELESRLDELNPSDRILIYCLGGVRSAEAADILTDNGFTHVYNMEGGITEWQAYGFPVIPGYTNVTPEEAYEMITQQEVVLLDVRRLEEYNSGHIADAILIPLSELESRLDELNPSDRILIYCLGGVRSAEAANILINNGFTHVYNMEGGITEWQAYGFPVTEPSPGYTNITPEEAYEMISQQDIVIVDVRTVNEYNAGHIPEAILIPLSELESRVDELNRSDYILIYCSTGGCQGEAAPRILVENGFSHVWNLKGGFVEWRADGFPVTEAEGSSCSSCS